MTHDKVRQDFYALFPSDRLEKVKNTDVIEAAFEGYLLGRAAKRAEIREKLESGGLVKVVEDAILAESDGYMSNPKIAKATITKILEVI